jgi:N-dimethylarginine dimethylaminohydrolase
MDTNRDIFDDVAPEMGRSRFVMCRPKYLSTKIPNNVFMEGKNNEPADVPRALNQWDRTAHIMEAFGVEVLEIPPAKGCQDQCYVANIGISIKPYIVLANFKAAGRACEVEPARKFFTGLGYNCIQPPFEFEGEADLKLWKEGVYFGGYGLFSSQQAFKWIEQKTGVQIIPVREIDPKTYHLDCSLLVVDENNFIVTKSGLDAASIKTLEKCGNIIFTPPDIATTGITNGVLIPEKKIFLSGTFNPEQPDYRKAMEWLLSTMDKLGYTVVLCDVDSYNPSGADLSCTVMHLTF